MRLALLSTFLIFSTTLATAQFCDSCAWVVGFQKISDTQGGFTGVLDNEDLFGRAVCNIGDLNGDGTTDLAVGAEWADDGGNKHGAVWILFLNRDGTVNSSQKISQTQGNLIGAVLSTPELLGVGITNLGDLDGDGVTDLGIADWHDDDGGTDRGAIWILFLNSDGTVSSHLNQMPGPLSPFTDI